jgi:dihydrofolate reductase
MTDRDYADKRGKDNPMRKLIYAINLTLDGCCDHIKVGAPDEEVFDYYIRLVRDADLFVYGRKTYELMVPYWPDIAKKPSGETKADKTDVEFARAFDSKKKVVFSKSLNSVDEKSRIVRTNLKDEILKLKQEPGNYILTGGVSIPAQLIELGLVDEFRFLVVPTLVGGGRRLLDGISLPEKFRLTLVESKVYKSGSVLLHYLKP